MGNVRVGSACRWGSLLATAVVLLAARDAAATTDVCYKGGTLLPNFKLNGNATLNGTDLIVTQSAGTQDSSIMYLPKFSTTNDIHIKLQVKISLNGNGGADGMAFVMHNAPGGASALGTAGGGIGYQGITNSVVVEFDTYFNAWDPNANHIAITRNGDPDHTTANNSIFPAPVTPSVNMKSGSPVYLWIDWDHSTKVLTVYIASTSTKPGSASLTANAIDLASMIGTTFYAGFTGSTGGAWSQHEVVELYASDHNADPTAACCTADADCTASSAGPICDINKHLCGKCTLESAGSCTGGTPACDLSQSNNSCASQCSGDNGSAGANPCGSSAFPACNGSGSCSTCKGDYLTGASVKCLSSAPYCSPNGYCGRCGSNADCSETVSTHLGTVCNASTGACVGSCTTSAQCGTGNFCNSTTCAALITNGNTCAAAGAASCVSAICDSDNKCGYADGRGTCTTATAATVCRSATCGTSSLKCAPSGGTGCAADTDCSAGNFCDGTSLTCTSKLSNGTALPIDSLHNSGVCSGAVGTAVCSSGVCGSDNKCGYANGAGSCTTGNGATVCRGGVCGSDSKCGYVDGAGSCTSGNASTVCRSSVCGASSGKCTPSGGNGCVADADCAAGEYCNGSGLLCVAQLGNGLAIPSDGLHTGTCTGDVGEAVCSSGVCDSDNKCGFVNGDGFCDGATAVTVCRSGACDVDSKCGLAIGSSGCTPGTAATCRSATCGAASGVCVPAGGLGCALDLECAAGTFCDGNSALCVAQLGNGAALPIDPLHTGACTGPLAMVVCAGGVCDTTDNRCGYANGDGTCNGTSGGAVCRSGLCGADSHCGYSDGTGSCTASTAPAVCRSGVCGATSGTCIPSGGSGCGADGDCPSGKYCDGRTFACADKLGNGTALTADGLHNNGACNVASGAAECVAGVCDADNMCGYANGNGACSTVNATTVCRGGACGADDKCGYADGTGSCTSGSAASVCRSGTCGASSKSCVPAGGGGCVADSDCVGSFYCNGNGHTCVGLIGNGVAIPSDGLHDGTCSPSTGAVVCSSGVCDTDNNCGFANGDGTCDSGSAATVCRSAACDPDSKCGLAVGSGTCSADNAAAVCRSATCGAGSGLCVPPGGQGCVRDNDCAAGKYCDARSDGCVGQLTNGAALPVDDLHDGVCAGSLGQVTCASGVCDPADNLCGFANGDGTCDADSGVTVCRGGTCGGDNKCGFADGTGACTADNAASVCRSGVCGMTSSICVPGGGVGCASDADCMSGKYCDGHLLVCVAALGNGVALPGDGLHDGTCSQAAGAAVCASGVCGNDSKCGFPNGHTGCTASAGAVCRSAVCDSDDTCGYANNRGRCDADSAATVCRSGVCGAGSSACVPAGGFGCSIDADCPVGKYCAPGVLMCVPLLANGTALPTDTLHNGTCANPLALAVCTSGACDIADNKCGVVVGDGACAVSNQCRTGVCIATGANVGKCKPCAKDDDCGGDAPACDLTTNLCVACTGDNSDACKGTTPICNLTSHACVGCAGDRGLSGVTPACPTAGAPFCGADGSCARCTANDQCAGATHGGVICNLTSGTCGTACATDGDCLGKWCNNPTGAPGAGVCEPKLGDGQPIPPDQPLAGACSPSAGQRVCESGVCDLADNSCGLANGRACTAATDCRSGVCNGDGKCGTPNDGVCTVGTACRSGICNGDGKCGAGNGDHCGASSDCRSGVCVAIDATCGALSGTSCSDDTHCRAGVCFSDGKCGLPNSQGCETGVQCRSGACVSGHCAGACTKDAECAAGSYCDAGVCAAALAAATACDRASQCLANVCASDGKCGDPDGNACAVNDTCRSGGCSGGQCGAVCTSAADCAAGFYCKQGACTATAANGAVCTAASQCQSGICAGDGKCGAADGQPCASGNLCRSGTCNTAGTCGTICASSDECAVGTYCDSSTHACVPAVPNGMTPPGGTCLPERCQSGVCAANDTCGGRLGDVCGANATCQVGLCDPADGRCGLGNGDGACTAGNAAQLCRSGVCDSDGKCGLADGDAPCSASSAAVCRSGVCGPSSGKCIAMASSSCASDGDCGPTGYCDGKTNRCTVRLTNGAAVPTDSLHDGTCATAALVCTSGKCDSADSSCGLGNDGPCTVSADCRSGKCSTATQKCAACTADADCTAAAGYCDAASGTCKQRQGNGMTCDRATQCTANACGSDAMCGQATGDACTSTGECRTGQCGAGACLPVMTSSGDQRRIGGGGLSCAIEGGGAVGWPFTGLGVLVLLGALARRRRRGR